MARSPLSVRLVEVVDALLQRHGSQRLQQAAYRVGYLVLRPWWFVTRPRIQGAKAVVRRGDRVLLVRHTYARRGMWDLPGGFVREGEPPEQAIRRELAEELHVVPTALRSIGSVRMRTDHKRELVHLFAADVDSDDVEPHLAELAEVTWVARDALPSDTRRSARSFVARSYWDVWERETTEAAHAS